MQDLHQQLREVCGGTDDESEAAAIVAGVLQEAADTAETEEDPEASVGALTQCLLDTCLTGNEAQCARVQAVLAAGILDVLPVLTRLVCSAPASAVDGLCALLGHILRPPSGLVPREAVAAITDCLAEHAESCGEDPALTALLLTLITNLPSTLNRVTRQRLACTLAVLHPCIICASHAAASLDAAAHAHALGSALTGDASKGTSADPSASSSSAQHQRVAMQLLSEGFAAPVAHIVVDLGREGLLGGLQGVSGAGGRGQQALSQGAPGVPQPQAQQLLQLLSLALQLLAVVAPGCCVLGPAGPAGARGERYVPAGISALVDAVTGLIQHLLPLLPTQGSEGNIAGHSVGPQPQSGTAAGAAAAASTGARQTEAQLDSRAAATWAQLLAVADAAGAAAHRASQANEDTGFDTDTDSQADNSSADMERTANRGAGLQPAAPAAEPPCVVTTRAGAAVLLWLRPHAFTPVAANTTRCSQGQGSGEGCDADGALCGLGQLTWALLRSADAHRSRSQLIAAMQLLTAGSRAAAAAAAQPTTAIPMRSAVGVDSVTTGTQGETGQADHFLPCCAAVWDFGRAGVAAAAQPEDRAAATAVSAACEAVCVWAAQAAAAAEWDAWVPLWRSLQVVCVNVVHSQEEGLRTLAYRCLCEVLSGVTVSHVRMLLLVKLLEEPSAPLAALLLQRVRHHTAQSLAQARQHATAAAQRHVSDEQGLAMSVAVAQLARAALGLWVVSPSGDNGDGTAGAAGVASQCGLSLGAALQHTLAATGPQAGDTGDAAAAVDAMCAALSVVRLLVLAQPLAAQGAHTDSAQEPSAGASIAGGLSQVLHGLCEGTAELLKRQGLSEAQVGRTPLQLGGTALGPSAPVLLDPQSQLDTALSRLLHTLSAVQEAIAKQM